MLKVVSSVGGGGGGISGSGTTNYLPKFASSTSLGDSKLLQAGTTILTQRNAAPTLLTTNNGTIPASALCTGYVFVGLNAALGNVGLYFPTGSSIDTELGLSGSSPTNVTFDCTFAWEYANDSGNTCNFAGNTGVTYPVGSYYEGLTYNLPDYGANTVTFRFYRTGAGTYNVYWGV